MPVILRIICVIVLLLPAGHAAAGEFLQPWRDKTRALVLDAYEFNQINWFKPAKDKRIAAVIGKASDGMPPKYKCNSDNGCYNSR